MKIPKDPKLLSYWVATNLPLDDSHRLKILEINCAVQRLRFELSLIEKVRVANANYPFKHVLNIFSLCKLFLINNEKLSIEESAMDGASPHRDR